MNIIGALQGVAGAVLALGIVGLIVALGHAINEQGQKAMRWATFAAVAIVLGAATLGATT